MSRESLHTVEEGEESNIRSLSPELFRASVLERLMESMEKITDGQNKLESRLTDRLTDLANGQYAVERRLADRLSEVANNQLGLEQRVEDLSEGQAELSRNQSEMSEAQSEIQRDQRSLLNRIEFLEANRQVSKEVSNPTNPDFSEPQPKVVELTSTAALPLETFVKKPIITESDGFEPDTLGPRR